ncbi:hypothetical protein Riv7116_4984 [Rivularia sp. PCC 7116]|uniref:CD-NTase-associated endodeoxyribonuclease Cap4 n=1 Tax=Rivularia sp. PCC 7116 TaxID=373994 RepID=UPI00029ED805|nr:SAVED domain-containing protein [Rivularia sp. PCC 7116]AFY57390.1 hypothetical protein Riv7116_4984 [Rivularia sp. PCC 7116]
MQQNHKQLKPSLLEPESKGGDIAEGGFFFQDNIMIAYIPRWLAQEGFTGMIRESIGDIEANFFVPGVGFVKEFLEVKNHSLKPTEFWKEIKRFQEVDDGSPGTYRWFTLVSTGLSTDLKPLVNGLRRLRDPYNFYENDSSIKDNSFQDYVQIVKKLGKDEQVAKFLFEKVFIQHEYSMAQAHGEALFRQSLIDHLREYEDLSNRILTDIYANFLKLIRQHKNQPISRKKVEIKLREKIDSKHLPEVNPILIFTSHQKEAKISTTSGLHFNWANFFGGTTRTYPPTKQWNQQLLWELEQTRNWIMEHRGVTRIRLTGNRRLTASLAIGSVFSSVAGFTVEMKYRSEIWATDAHPNSSTPEYSLSTKTVENGGEHLIITVAIIRDIAAEVEASLEHYGLDGMPVLHIHGQEAIISSEQANLAVRKIKNLISDTLAVAKSKQVHLFLATPAHLTLFLGHRLNAIAPIQCYEWTSPQNYTQTCLLSAKYNL